MNPIDVTVISTGFRPPTKQRCLDSVRDQKSVRAEHIYLDAAEQKRPLGQIANILSVVGGLPKDQIVALVDGDDWLRHDYALWKVLSLYDEDVWLTYGSFEHEDGSRPTWTGVYTTDAFRAQAWFGTHLKTFRAGLLQKVAGKDLLTSEGEEITLATDMAMMFPMMEMAGLSRIRHCPDVVYVYHRPTSYGAQGLDARANELAVERYLRCKEPYARLEKL